MRNLLVQRISNKPPICHIHADFFQYTAQRTNAVNVLNKSTILNSTTGFMLGRPLSLRYKSSTNSYTLLKSIAASICLSRWSILGDHLFQAHKLNLVSVFNIFRKHVHHPYLLYYIFSCFMRKRPPIGDLFRQAEPAGICRRVSCIPENQAIDAWYKRGQGDEVDKKLLLVR